MSYHTNDLKNVRRELTARRPPRTLPETRDCIEFALRTIDRIRPDLDKIENMTLGRAQSIVFNIKTEISFLRGELAACIPPPAEPCRHERLNEDGFCRTCSADRRGI